MTPSRAFFAARIIFWAWAWFWERASIVILLLGGIVPLIAWWLLTCWWLFCAAVIWHHQKSPALELHHAAGVFSGRIKRCPHGWAKRGYTTADSCPQCHG